MTAIELTKGFFAKVDDQDVEMLKPYSWCVMGPTNGGYYAVSRIKYALTSMSRFLLNAQKGDYVDHLNGDTLDNRRFNLRLCRNGESIPGAIDKNGRSANGMNIRNSKLSKRNKTGQRGVYWSEKRQRFIADAKIGTKRLHRQSRTLEEAAKMFREFMERELEQDFETEIYPKQFATKEIHNAAS